MSTFAATLDRFVTIRRPGPARDAAGQPVASGSIELRQDWANIRHTGGLETIRAGAVTSTVNASIRMRYCEDIDSSMQIVYGPTVYQIVSVQPGDNRVHIDFVCEVVK